MAKSHKPTDKELLQFAHQLEQLYEDGVANKRQVLLFSFLKGIATGFGVFLGGTIVVALLLWGLSRLSDLPFVGQLSKSAEHSIQGTSPNN
ncbi:MAG TPA: DUF5665 domain-containing protein [Nevskiaceae bacterium]|nr:DUF5665 domain-containing protein [Nevskiaceae bacterium]